MGKFDRKDMLRAVEAVVDTGGNIALAAKNLRMPRSNLYTLLAHALVEGLGDSFNLPRDQRVPNSPSDLSDPPATPSIRVRVRPDAHERWSVVVVGDFHSSPAIRDQRGKWIGRYAAEALSSAPDKTALIQIGDFASFDSFSFHDRNETLSGRAKPSFAEDLEAWNDDLDLFDLGLDGLETDVRHEVMGNHDCPRHGRPYRWMNANPEMAGIIDFEVTRMLERHGWSWSPFGHHYMVGGVGFTHAPLGIMGRPVGGEQPSNTVSLKSVYDTVYGHTHKPDDARKPKLGHGEYVRAVNVGCSLPWGHFEHYINHGAMTGWWWGVYKLEIWGGHIQEVESISMKRLEEEYGDG